MSNYLFELAVIHMTLIGVYWVFLKKENQYAKLRFYLLASTVLSIAIPFLKLPKLFSTETAMTRAISPVQAITIEPIAITPGAQPIGQTYALEYIYAGISILLLLAFIIKVRKLVWMERSSRKSMIFGTKVRFLSGISGSFSFFNWIFISDDQQDDSVDRQAILRHERAHSALGHTYDLVFLELYKIAFWWLPTAWIIQKELKKIHEYQADAHAIKEFSIDRYSSILISSTLKIHGLSLASSFHDGLIFNRLNAMKQKAKNVSPWKIGGILLLTATLFVVFACSEEMEASIQKMSESSNAISYDQLPDKLKIEFAEAKDDLTFLRVELTDNLSNEEVKKSISDIDELKNIDPNTLHTVTVIEEQERKAVYLAIRKEGANFDLLAEKSKLHGNVFTVVEKLPQYPGGMDALYAYVAQNIKYPEAPRKAGVEGRVMVQFVVETDGRVTNVQALKGIHPDADAEAVRVVQGAENFTPGEQRGKKVRTQMILPISFKLGDGDSGKKNHGIIAIDKVDMYAAKLGVDVKFVEGAWRGKVVDENQQPMAGVNIVESGTSNGTVSDLDGTFALKLMDKKNEVIISFVGYESIKLQTK